MKNILFITYVFPPVNSVDVRRTYSWVKYLNRLGYTLHVLTADVLNISTMHGFDVDCSDLHIHRVKYFDIRSLAAKTANISAVDIAEKDTAKIKFIRRILNAVDKYVSSRGCLFGNARMPTFADQWLRKSYKKARKLVEEQKIDIIITSSPPPTVNLLGSLLKRKFDYLLWIGDFRDLWTLHPSFNGLPIFSLIERYLEKKCFHRLDVVITVSNILRNCLKKRYPASAIHVIENGYDDEMFAKVVTPASPVSFRESPGKTIGYFGTVYRTRSAPDLLCKAVEKLWKAGKIPSLDILFFGSYASGAFLEEVLKKYSVNDVIRYKGYLSAEDTIRRMKQCDVLLFIENDTADDGVLTGKIFEYMYIKKPILCIGLDRGSYIGEFLYKTGLCYFCGNDQKKVEEYLLRLHDNIPIPAIPDENYIAQFSRKNQVGKLHAIISSLDRRMKQNSSIAVEKQGKGR